MEKHLENLPKLAQDAHKENKKYFANLRKRTPRDLDYVMQDLHDKEFEKTGKHDFLKNFIFNICPENSEGNFPGYVTEKLMDACISGTLPIYYGKLDNIDQNIFNIKRVLFYIPSCKITVTNVVEKIKRLMNCPNELFDFYNQDIFNKDAHIYINQMIHAFKNKVDTI